MAGQVVRIWRGFGSADGVERYCSEHFLHVVLPQLRALEGFLGATLLVRQRVRDTQVVVMTRWESVEAIRRFAGEDYERAVVEPEVHDLLEDFDKQVEHFSVAAEA